MKQTIKTPDGRFIQSDYTGDATAEHGWEKLISPNVIEVLNGKKPKSVLDKNSKKKLGRPTGGKHTGKIKKIPADPPKPTRERTCLRCPKKFQSEGNHHRLCIDCRRLSDN